MTVCCPGWIGIRLCLKLVFLYTLIFEMHGQQNMKLFACFVENTISEILERVNFD